MKKKFYQVQAMTSDEVYALLDAVGSDDEEDVDNLMNDSDTEFVEDGDGNEMSIDQLEIGVSAVVHEDLHAHVDTTEDELMQNDMSRRETSHQPANFKWKNKKRVIQTSDCSYDGRILLDIGEDDSCFDVFRKVTDLDALLNLLVEESIRYARQNGREFTIDKEEMAAFLGINYIMSISTLPTLESYWSTDEAIGNRRIQKVMTRARFRSILQNLHFSDNEAMDKDDRAAKVRVILNHFNRCFQLARDNTSCQSIDEHMCKFKGKSGMKQFIKNKPIRWGFKLWFRCASADGYLYELDIYLGKQVRTSGFGVGESVVLQLTELLKDSHVTIYADNFFAAPILAKTLLENGIYFNGTVRSNRKGMPSNLKVRSRMFGMLCMHSTAMTAAGLFVLYMRHFLISIIDTA